MRKYNQKYKKGDWKAICDVCGQLYKASELTKRWDNLMVCKWDYEERHPMDYLRAVKDEQDVPWTRTESDDIFTDSDCTDEGRTAIAGVAIAGCSITGRE